ncbi:MAG TPA: aminotransferase class I/II-fold pyridoxal phosphate-dependent enzyme [Bacteroidia bacterium]|jgi:perosamine synthetase|nr:aminotransferase class I/II-fold pyridoxal phosphate-dependent enzyme [Bacteroidia bacterium]
MSHIPTLEEMLITEDHAVKDALKVIDQNAQGTCFVVNASKKLVGVITDGDIRRGFIAGKTLDSKVSEVMEKNFTSLPVTTPIDQITAKISAAITHIPLVDENNIPVDYASFSRAHRIPVMTPQLSGNELKYVTECVTTGWISSQGSYVKRFEKEFSEYCGVKYGVAVSNGTVAIHLALAALGIGEGDEVIVPDLTFAASINGVIYTGATPVIADVDPETWTLSPKEVERLITPRTKAIMPVHLYGHPCHMDELMAIAKKHKLFVVEDCAEALGAKYKGKHVGGFGDAATFSFFGNKTITTGEGGMVLFNDEAVANKAMVLRDHGMSKQKRYWHDLVGFNYRMTNIQAAIGVAQLERLDEFVQAKRNMAAVYNKGLQQHKITLPPEKEWAFNGYWLYTCIIDPKNGVSRDEFIDKLMKNGVETRPVFYPLHEMPPYLKYVLDGQKFPATDHISRNGLSLPSSVTITAEEQQTILNAFNAIYNTRKLNVNA